MSTGFPESDWKVLRRLERVALERFCERALGKVTALANDSSQTHHERYLKVYKLVKSQDQELRRRRSQPSPARQSMARGSCACVISPRRTPGRWAPGRSTSGPTDRRFRPDSRADRSDSPGLLVN
jgi:hypothetical protein